MSQEKFIKPREPRLDGTKHNHAGRHSHFNRLAEAKAKIDDWRRQRELSHQRGFTPEPLPRVDIDSLPEDQEITLFDPVTLRGPAKRETGTPNTHSDSRIEENKGLEISSQFPNWFPREPHVPPNMGAEITFPNPFTTGEQMHLMRRSSRHVTRDGKR